MLADVGLLGLPNAGKSTFIRAVSAAAKVAGYPATLHPHLGVVRVDANAALGWPYPAYRRRRRGRRAGPQFLRHLQRTRLLLHIVDLAPMHVDADPVRDAKAIVEELRKYDTALFEKPRWVVLNKADLIPQGEREARVKAFVDGYFGKRRRARKGASGQTSAFCPLDSHRRGLPELSWRDGVPERWRTRLWRLQRRPRRPRRAGAMPLVRYGRRPIVKSAAVWYQSELGWNAATSQGPSRSQS